jgi:hypothetical protein
MKTLAFKASLMLFLIIGSCKQRDVVIDVTRQTPDLIKCTKVFGYSLNKIISGNELLVQTGMFNASANGEDKPAAVVRINNSDRVLYLETEKAISGEKTEVYGGDGYSLSLRYIEKQKGNDVYYDGYCRLRKGLTITDYKIEGQPGPRLLSGNN